MTADRLGRNLDYIRDIPEKLLLRVTNRAKHSRSVIRKLVQKSWSLVEGLRKHTSSIYYSRTASVPQAISVNSRKSHDNSSVSQSKSTGTCPKYLLYRIIGNDLYPRHNDNQSLQNLEFILQHEPPLVGCEKRWILNRIRNNERFDELRRMLDARNLQYDVIPFELEKFLDTPWDWDILPAPDFFASRQFRSLSRHQRQSWELAFYRLKNNYLMNNNGARNYALALGKKEADYILPWDGNCFVTNDGWRDITDAVSNSPTADYFYVPMQRISDNRDLLLQTFKSNPKDEPQLIFKSTSSEVFNSEYAYGRRPKVELLWRLGIPGIWDQWTDEPWDQPRRSTISLHSSVDRAGWVARLHSGVRDAETQSSGNVLSQKSRYSARNYAIRASINQVIYEHLAISQCAYSEYWMQPLTDRMSYDQLNDNYRAAESILGAWSEWWKEGFKLVDRRDPPRVRQHDLLSAFAYLLWKNAVAVKLGQTLEPSVHELINLLGDLLFASEEYRLKPRLRLLRRPLAHGRLAGTWPNLQSIEQIVAISDLCAWSSPSFPWLSEFESWRSELSSKLQSLVNHNWLSRVPGDLERLQISLLLLRRHQGDISGSIDIMSLLVSSLYSDRVSESHSAHIRTIVEIAPQYGFPVGMASLEAQRFMSSPIPAPSLAPIIK